MPTAASPRAQHAPGPLRRPPEQGPGQHKQRSRGGVHQLAAELLVHQPGSCERLEQLNPHKRADGGKRGARIVPAWLRRQRGHRVGQHQRCRCAGTPARRAHGAAATAAGARCERWRCTRDALLAPAAAAVGGARAAAEPVTTTAASAGAAAAAKGAGCGAHHSGTTWSAARCARRHAVQRVRGRCATPPGGYGGLDHVTECPLSRGSGPEGRAVVKSNCRLNLGHCVGRGTLLENHRCRHCRMRTQELRIRACLPEFDTDRVSRDLRSVSDIGFARSCWFES